MARYSSAANSSADLQGHGLQGPAVGHKVEEQPLLTHEMSPIIEDANQARKESKLMKGARAAVHTRVHGSQPLQAQQVGSQTQKYDPKQVHHELIYHHGSGVSEQSTTVTLPNRLSQDSQPSPALKKNFIKNDTIFIILFAKIMLFQ